MEIGKLNNMDLFLFTGLTEVGPVKQASCSYLRRDPRDSGYVFLVEGVGEITLSLGDVQKSIEPRVINDIRDAMALVRSKVHIPMDITLEMPSGYKPVCSVGEAPYYELRCTFWNRLTTFHVRLNGEYAEE